MEQWNEFATVLKFDVVKLSVFHLSDWVCAVVLSRRREEGGLVPEIAAGWLVDAGFPDAGMRENECV